MPSKLFIPNFRIYATVPSEEFVIDPDTGNSVRVMNTLEITAWMQGKPTKGKPEHPSVDFNTVYLAGHCVTPRMLPPRTILAREKYRAEYTEPITGTCQQGTFILAPQVESNRPRVARRLAQRLGTQIQGTFEFGFYGES